MTPSRVAILFVLGALTLLWLRWRLERRPRKRRGANSHHNADGSAKRAYRTRRGALRAARQYQRDFGDAMAAYRCERRRHWHIGHTRSRG